MTSSNATTDWLRSGVFGGCAVHDRVTEAGQTWLMKMSTRWDEVWVLRKAEREVFLAVADDVDVVMLETSFSTVCEEKNGSENP